MIPFKNMWNTLYYEQTYTSVLPSIFGVKNEEKKVLLCKKGRGREGPRVYFSHVWGHKSRHFSTNSFCGEVQLIKTVLANFMPHFIRLKKEIPIITSKEAWEKVCRKIRQMDEWKRCVVAYCTYFFVKNNIQAYGNTPMNMGYPAQPAKGRYFLNRCNTYFDVKSNCLHFAMSKT